MLTFSLCMVNGHLILLHDTLGTFTHRFVVYDSYSGSSFSLWRNLKCNQFKRCLFVIVWFECNLGKHARVSFFTDDQKNSRVYVFPNCTRNHILLLIIYMKKIMQSHACVGHMRSINHFNRKSTKNASHFCHL
jgi:hypothetical protein